MALQWFGRQLGFGKNAPIESDAGDDCACLGTSDEPAAKKARSESATDPQMRFSLSWKQSSVVPVGRVIRLQVPADCHGLSLRYMLNPTEPLVATGYDLSATATGLSAGRVAAVADTAAFIGFWAFHAHLSSSACIYSTYRDGIQCWRIPNWP